MNLLLKKSAITIFVITCIIILIIMRVNNVSNKEKVKRKNNSIGKYKLSLVDSDLGNYKNDSASYSSLELNLNEDMSFLFSISTPFIYDSVGTWNIKEVGIYGYNLLIYNKNKNFKNQITPCCFNNDRIQIKLPISRDGFKQVDLLVFRKVE